MRLNVAGWLACLAIGVMASTGWSQTISAIEAPMSSYVSEAFARGNKLYATITGGRYWGVYSYDWTARRWSKLNGPVEQIAVTESGKLYARLKDSVISYSSEGNKWYTIGGPSRRIIVGGEKLYSIEPQKGDVYMNTGSDQWRKIGGPADFHAADSNGTLYGLGKAGLWVYSGTGENWSQISQSTGAGLFGGGKDKIFTMSAKGAIWEYNSLRRDWKQWTAEGLTQGAVISQNDTIAYSIKVPGEMSDTATAWIALGPMNSKKINGGAVGNGSDCILINLPPYDKAQIGFVKR